MKKLLVLLVVAMLSGVACNKNPDKQVIVVPDQGGIAEQKLVKQKDETLPIGNGKDEAIYKGKPTSFWIKQLRDSDPNFRLDAVNALREIGTDGDGVVLALVKTLADKEPTVRDAAREAIASIPLDGKVPALVQILRGKDQSVHLAAITLLGEIGSKAKDSVPTVVKVLKSDDENLRIQAVRIAEKITSVPNRNLAIL